MAQQTKEDKQLLRDRILLRAKTAYLYHSGKLDNMFIEAVEQGESPWQIVSYERITNPENHLCPLPMERYVRPKTFEKHLKYYAKECHVIPLAELAERIYRGDRISPKP